MKIDDVYGILPLDESMQTAQQIVDLAAERVSRRVGVGRTLAKRLQYLVGDDTGSIAFIRAIHGLVEESIDRGSGGRRRAGTRDGTIDEYR